MKIGMTSLTFGSRSIEEVINIAQNAGIDGIEWGVRDNHAVNDENLYTIKELSLQTGIEIFSLGSYCYMTDLEDCKKTVDMAAKLSAPVIRIWAGKKSPWDCDEKEFDSIVGNAKGMAEYADQFGIALGFEYHNHSLTETSESAVSLAKAIDCKNVGLYWQNNENLSYEQNKNDLQQVTPYLAGIFHIQNHTVKEGKMLLEDIVDNIAGYLKPFGNTDYRALIEFVKNGDEDYFYRDVKALRMALER